MELQQQQRVAFSVSVHFSLLLLLVAIVAQYS